MGMPHGAFVDSWSLYLDMKAADEAKRAKRARISTLYTATTTNQRPHQGRCVSCGSSEFFKRDGQTICAYCRGAA